MKISVVYNDGYNTRQSTFDNANDFDIDAFGNLLVIKSEQTRPVAIFASGTWSNVFEV